MQKTQIKTQEKHEKEWSKDAADNGICNLDKINLFLSGLEESEERELFRMLSKKYRICFESGMPIRKSVIVKSRKFTEKEQAQFDKDENAMEEYYENYLDEISMCNSGPD